MTYRDYPPAAIVHPEGGYRGSQSRIPEDVQATVLQLHEEGRSVRDIARRAGIAVGTVSRLVHAAGLSFDQDATHRATLARSRQLRAKRTELAEQLTVTAYMSVALAQAQMLEAPGDHRSRAEAVKAVRDAAAALVDVVKVDMPQSSSEMEQEGAEAFLDGVVTGIRDLDLDQLGPNQVVTFTPAGGGGHPPDSELGSSSPLTDIAGAPPHGQSPQEQSPHGQHPQDPDQ